MHFHLHLRSVCRRFQSSSGWQEEAAAVLDKANEDKEAGKVRERQREPLLPELGKGLELQRERAAPGTGSRAGCGVGTPPGPRSGAGAVTAPSGAACGAEPPDRLRGG